jgi:hypothetical protein
VGVGIGIGIDIEVEIQIEGSDPRLGFEVSSPSSLE